MSNKQGVRHFFVALALSAMLALLAVCVPNTYGQVSGITSDDANLTAAERREVTLRWLDKFLTESDLLRKEDMFKIRNAVANMSPSQLQTWLDQTRVLRAFVEGDQWQKTKTWLKGFLRVQNIYSDQEILQLRRDIVNADAKQLLAILKQIQAQHDKMVWMHQASERNRQVSVSERDSAVQRQAEANRMARAARGGSQPLFGSTQGRAASQYKSYKGYAPPRPLITSRQVSRAAVWSEMGPIGWYIGW